MEKVRLNNQLTRYTSKQYTRSIIRNDFLLLKDHIIRVKVVPTETQSGEPSCHTKINLDLDQTNRNMNLYFPISILISCLSYN